MEKDSTPSPRNAVFTTVVWDGGSHLADLKAHLDRMETHAQRLRIAWPKHMMSEINREWEKGIGTREGDTVRTPSGLIRLELTRAGDISLEARPFILRNEGIEAVTVPAPRWSPKINGTKHGDWSPYVDAMQHADTKGADLALMVHDYALVDGDRATPLVIDEDGTAWLAAPAEGGVMGITAELLAPLLEQAGVPVHRGRLNERLVARALEVVALGSGIGASRIESIDGEPVGSNHEFSEKCQTLLTQHYETKNAWTHVGA